MVYSYLDRYPTDQEARDAGLCSLGLALSARRRPGGTRRDGGDLARHARLRRLPLTPADRGSRRSRAPAGGREGAVAGGRGCGTARIRRASQRAQGHGARVGTARGVSRGLMADATELLVQLANLEVARKPGRGPRVEPKPLATVESAEHGLGVEHVSETDLVLLRELHDVVVALVVALVERRPLDRQAARLSRVGAPGGARADPPSRSGREASCASGCDGQIRRWCQASAGASSTSWRRSTR